ncbi:MAG TPA: lipid-A-disaccharide synthase [Gammaproteobacteria bacterium]
MKIGIVAGEASGDILAAGLLRELRERHPDMHAEGIAGPEMIAAGCRALWPLEKLSVMGLVEVLAHLPELLRLRRDAVAHFSSSRPDVFIGVDSPDFNLGMESRLKRRGIRTVQYVSPSIWAWRQGRAAKIGRGTDLVLCLFPFEPEIYARHGTRAVFVGHPLADTIPEFVDPIAARMELGLPAEGKLLALLPGSRMSEAGRLADAFFDTVRWLRERDPELRAVIPAATPRIRAFLEGKLAAFGDGTGVTIVDGRSRDIMAAADVVLLASGTAALEALLLKRPMVVSYRLNALTYFLVRLLRLLKLPYVSLPNVLAGERIVPECLQGDARADVLGPEVLMLLRDAAARDAQTRIFGGIHATLRCNASRRAADAVLELARPSGENEKKKHGRD